MYMCYTQFSHVQIIFFSLISFLSVQNSIYGMTTVCVCVCMSVLQFKVLTSLTNFHNVWYKSYITENHIIVTFISCSQQ